MRSDGGVALESTDGSIGPDDEEDRLLGREERMGPKLLLKVAARDEGDV